MCVCVCVCVRACVCVRVHMNKCEPVYVNVCICARDKCTSFLSIMLQVISSSRCSVLTHGPSTKVHTACCFRLLCLTVVASQFVY